MREQRFPYDRDAQRGREIGVRDPRDADHVRVRERCVRLAVARNVERNAQEVNVRRTIVRLAHVARRADVHGERRLLEKFTTYRVREQLAVALTPAR